MRGYCGANPRPRIPKQGPHVTFKIPRGGKFQCNLASASSWFVSASISPIRFSSELYFPSSPSLVARLKADGQVRLNSLNAGTIPEGKYVSPSIALPSHRSSKRLFRAIIPPKILSKLLIACIAVAFDEEDRLAGRNLSFLHAVACPNEKPGELGEELIYDAPFLILNIL
jgi:hypothetical protein